MQGAQILRNEAYIEVRCNDKGCSATQPFGFAQGHEPVEWQMDFLRSRQKELYMDAERLLEMDRRIQSIKKSIIELHDLGREIEAVAKNSDRILASIRMLELNISDLIPLLERSD
jgi:hypothetical protein